MPAAHRLRCLVVFCAALILPPIISADSIWNGSSADWNTAGNWSPSGVPSGFVQINSGTANITSANASTSGGAIGYSSGSAGTVNVLNGRTWNATSSSFIFNIGRLGNGTLNIQSGGTVFSQDGTVGSLSGSVGAVTVNGTGSTWTIWSNLTVSSVGNGTLNIQAGGTVNIYGSGNLNYIGVQGTGTATVTGAGSSFTINGYLRIGDQTGGTGTLTVDAGGRATMLGTYLAISSNAKGILNLNGTSGSRGVVETGYISEGSGTLGGFINFNGGILRATADSTDFLQNFEAADVQVLSGGAFIDTNGHNVTVNSTVQFNGTGGITKQGSGTLTLSGDRQYHGSSVVEAGTLANSNNGYLGYNASDTSNMTVTGSGSQWTTTVELYVGYSGNGTLNIQNGGLVGSSSAYIGMFSPSTSAVTVNGTGSQWNNGNLFVGGSGSGTLNIQNGGTVSTTQIGYIANNGGTGLVNVNGSGSQWNLGFALNVGYFGSGTLIVDAGGKVTAPSVTMADSGAGKGTLNLNGTSGSRGVLETAGLMKGTGSGGATINFSGGILRATADSANFLQGFGASDVQVQSGGAFIDTNGHNVTVNSTVQFNGTGGITKQGAGTLTLSGNRSYNGSNTVEAGTLANAFGLIGNGSTGTVTVTGAGSQWSNSSQLFIGYFNNGTLNIQNGGKVSDTDSFVGYNTGWTGTVTVDGAGSQWNNSGLLRIGQDGNGTLNIQNGGSVNDTSGSIGTFVSTGTVTVTGAGSQWTHGTDLRVGENGDGTLTVDAGGKVTTPYALMANRTGGTTSKGTLNLNGTSGSRGVLETGYISEGTGTLGGFINFNGGILRATATQADFIQSFEAGDVQIKNGGAFVDTQAFNVGISTVLQNAAGNTGTFNKQGTGKLTLSGASTYTGLTTVEEGTLQVTGSLTSDVTVQSNATLSGTGTVKAVTVQSGAKISPGVSGFGTLNTLGETWNGGGTYAWDVNAKPSSGTAGTNWDFLNITGGLNITATSGNKFTIDINGSVTGIADFSLLDWTILTTTTGFGGTFSANAFILDSTDFTSNTGGVFSILTQGNNLVLEYAAAPEPSRAVLLLLGCAGLMMKRRRSAERFPLRDLITGA